MLFNFLVNIPVIKGRVYRRKATSGFTYVEYEYAREYHKEKKYNTPKRTTIGRVSDEDPSQMYPNENFYKFFPDAEMPEEKSERSVCLKVGAFILIRKIICDYKLDEMADRIIGKDAGLFLDLAAYSIICEDNALQYYPDYAFNHPLFTEGMRIYSDSKVSDFLHNITRDQSVSFLNEWNESRDHREKIYISYDSSNKICQAGDIALAEIGNPKDGGDKPVINYAVAYDRDNREPLFYEDYPGSVVDVAQLQCMLDTAKGYGYKKVGFILDRGYFSKGNIQYMDQNGYDFVIMVKGMKELVAGLVLEKKGTFEDKRHYAITAYHVEGITVKHKLYPEDEKQRSFHIYFSSAAYAAEKRRLEVKLSGMRKSLKRMEHRPYRLKGEYLKYFSPIYYHEGKEDEKYIGVTERTGVIDREISLAGYFVIVTSKEMTAREALTLYKSRDGSEKLFRGDKAYLGNRTGRVYTDESEEAKIFVEFIALIIRNKIYTCLKDETERNETKANYMTVPAALKELEKIEMVKRLDQTYRMSHAVTARQKAILKAFDITAEDIRKQAVMIGRGLLRRGDA